MLTLRVSSHISAMHHIGTIMVAQAAIAISLNLTREKDATIEFILCTVWGKSGLLTLPLSPLREGTLSFSFSSG